MDTRASPPLKRKRSTGDQPNATLAIHLSSCRSKPHRIEFPDKRAVDNQTTQEQRKDQETSSPPADVWAVPNSDDDSSDAVIPEIIAIHDDEVPTQIQGTPIELHAHICHALPDLLGNSQPSIAQLDQLAYHYRTDAVARTWMLPRLTSWLDQQYLAMLDQQVDWASVYSLENGALSARVTAVILELIGRSKAYSREEKHAETLINLIETFTRWLIRLIGAVSRTGHEEISKKFRIICARPLQTLQDAASPESLFPLPYFLHNTYGLDQMCVRNAIGSQLRTPEVVRDMARLLLELIKTQEEAGEVATNMLAPLSVSLVHAMHCTIRAIGKGHDRFASSAPLLELPARIASILKMKTDKETPESNCLSRKMLLEAGAHISYFVQQPLPTNTVLHTMTQEEVSSCVRFAWLIDVVRHLITTGYLTLRIVAMEVMVQYLTGIYNQYIKFGRPHKVHNFAAQHLQCQGILDIVLGADSHVELLNRARDMLNFFVFTRQLTQKVSDLFWQATLRTGQDQQAAAALGTCLAVLTRSGAELRAQDLLTFCTSLLKHPLPEISPMFCDLIKELNRQALEHVKEEVAEKHADAHIVLQVRLLEVSLHASSPTRTMHDLQQEVEKTLSALGRLEGDLSDDRSSCMRNFVEQCIVNIASVETRSDASVLALTCLCNGSDAILRFLGDETRSFEVVKDEVCHVVQNTRKPISEAQKRSFEQLLWFLFMLSSQLSDRKKCVRTLFETISGILRPESLKELRDATLLQCTRYIIQLPRYVTETLRARQSPYSQLKNSAELGQSVGGDHSLGAEAAGVSMLQGMVMLMTESLRTETISPVMLSTIHFLVGHSGTAIAEACTAGRSVFHHSLIDSLWQAIVLAPTEHLANTAALTLAETLFDLTTSSNFAITVGEADWQKVLDEIPRNIAEQCFAALEEAFGKVRSGENDVTDRANGIIRFKRILRFMGHLTHVQSGSSLPNTTDTFRRSARMNELASVGEMVKLTCNVQFDSYRKGTAAGPRNFFVRVGTYETERKLFLRLAFILGSTALDISWGDRRIFENSMQLLEPNDDTRQRPISMIVRPAVNASSGMTSRLAEDRDRLMTFLDGGQSDELSASTFEFLEQSKKGQSLELGSKTLIDLSRLNAFDRPFEALDCLGTLMRIVDSIEIGQHDFVEAVGEAQRAQTTLDQSRHADSTDRPQEANGNVSGQVNGFGSQKPSRIKFERYAAAGLQSLLLDQRISASRSRIFIRIMRDAARCLAALLRIAQNRVADLSAVSTTDLIRQLIHLCAGPLASGGDGTDSVTPFYELLIAYAMSSEVAGACFRHELATSRIHRELIFRSSDISQATYICQLIRTHLQWKEFATLDFACGPNWGLKSLTALKFFWTELADCIDHTVVSNDHDISVGLEMLNQLTAWMIESKAEELELQENMRRYSGAWLDALVRYKRIKTVDLRASDNQLYQLASLLQKCFEVLARELGEASYIGSIDLLYSKYFPYAASLAMKNDGEGGQIMPITANTDRKVFYEMIYVLAIHNPSIHQRLMELETEALDRVKTTLSNCWIAQGTLLRANHGFVGMRNLGATCYQNSVLVQLFMNADLRRFLIANAEMPEPNSKSSVLTQTQKCFAYLQESFRKSYDTQGLAACMKAGDGLEIPVTEQMDIREFYNLLFDQWEAELPSEVLRKQLRSFYGGAQVSRIQSKSCPHISEREEPFSSIQCTLDGAENLTQSLANIVKGEQLNGENKYNCEICGHIDATRLTSFKDLPDSVAFHLMRFRYDVMASGGGAMKNPDYFSFPISLDMSPYTYAHLTSGDSQPDMFELVGAIQHAGNTAEGGHYISYAQIEPATAATPAKWAELNDEKVTQVNLADIEFQLYGGPQDDGKSMKNFSAYMLFYRRIPSAPQEATTINHRDRSKATIPQQLLREIMLDNAQVVQDYGFLGQSYKQHIWGLINIAAAGTDQDSKHNATRLFCAYISRILNRRATVSTSSKTTTLDDTIDHFFRTIGKDDSCLLTVLDWFTKTEQALCDVMIRGTGQRSFCCKLFQRIFKNILSSDDPDCVRELQMIGCTDVKDSIPPETVRQSIIYKFLAALRDVADADDFYEPQLEHWLEYHKLHLNLASLNKKIACIMVEQGYLLQCLKLFNWHRGDAPFAGGFSHLFDWRAADAYNRMRRPQVMPLEPPGLVLHQLLHVLDLKSPAATVNQDRFVLMSAQEHLQIPISELEEYLLNLQHEGKSIWLDLLLEFLENTTNKVWSSADQGGSANKEIICAKGVMGILHRSRLPQRAFEQAMLNGLTRGLVGHIQAAVPIALKDGETDFTKQCFESVVRATENFDGDNESYIAFSFLHDLNEQACWRRPLLVTVARWAPRLMSLLATEDEEALMVFIKELLDKKWLTADGTRLAADSEHVLSAMRALFDQCNKEFNVAYAKSPARGEVEDLHDVMKMCVDNLAIVAKHATEMPENCKDDADYLRLETFKGTSRSNVSYPE